MTIEEINKKRKELSIEIAQSIYKFEQETGAEVEGLRVDFVSAKTELGDIWDKRAYVNVYLKNPYED